MLDATMIDPQAETPRDPVRAAPYYESVVQLSQDAIHAYTSHGNPALFMSVVPHFLRIASARYSAGAPISACRQALDEAVEHQERFIVEGRKYQFAGRGGIDNYLELYSAAHLVGRSSSLITVLRQCVYAEPERQTWLPRLIQQFGDALLGLTVETDAAQQAELAKVDPRIAVLPGLFAAVSHHDVAAATVALERYLVQYWGPPIEKQAKRDLKSVQPVYCGKWCFLSAAMCRVLGTVPDLSLLARRYVPVDLLAET